MPVKKPATGRKPRALTKAAKSSSATPPIAPAPADGAHLYTAFEFKQHANAPSLVLFHTSVADVLSWSSIGELEVPRKSPRKTGPQREQKLAKVRAIRKFLDSDARNIIPSAVIVAFSKGAATFQRSGLGSTGELAIRGADAATIVDGQHRLYGMKEYSPTTQVAIVGLLEADHVDKAFHFLVINNKSTRVPATHTKALLSRMQQTSLADRLKAARISFEAEGIKDIDLVNSDRNSPFYETIDWTTTPKAKRMVQATSIEMSLDYMSNLGVAEFEDRDVRRNVFITMWKTIQNHWVSLWKPNSRLVSKIGIYCLTRFVVDMIVKWSDNEDLDIDPADLEDISEETDKIISLMDSRFWTTDWAERSEGGFDTKQGRERVVRALTQLYRNGRYKDEWYADIDIIDRTTGDQSGTT
jgi:DGQHR domain-containing protein